jgi:hypothetical protein
VAEAQSRLRDLFPEYGVRGSLTDAPAETPRTALLEQYGSIVEPYEPSLSEKIYNFAFDTLGGNTATGLDRQRIQRRARYPQKIIDQTALAGITDYSQAMQDYARGDALSGTTNLAMAATSFIPGQQRQAVDEITRRLLKGTFGQTLDTSNIQVPFRSPVSPDTPQIPFRADTPAQGQSALRNLTDAPTQGQSAIEPQTDVPVIPRRQPSIIMPDDRVISPDQLMPELQGMTERRVLDNTPENLDQYIRFKGGKINAQPKPLVADVLSGISQILAPKTVTPEDLYNQGSPLIGVLGDRSDANALLTGADGMQFENPVPLEGGYKFMQTNPKEKGVWASNRGEVKKLEGQIQRAGGEANLVYTPMAETGGDFSTMMTDSLFERIKNSKITKENKAAFDKAVRAKIPEWKGVDHPEARFQLQRVGALRHIFNGLVGRDEFQKMGFPDLATSRFSITAPELVGVPTLHGGQAIGRTQGKRVESPVNPHGSYDTQQLGEYVGGLPIATPAQVMFPDFFGIRRLAGKPVSGDYRAYQLGEVVQEPNQQWLDGMMKYYESVEPR